jgi:hypothetical protein
VELIDVVGGGAWRVRCVPALVAIDVVGGGVVTDHTEVGAVHPLRGLLVAGERMGWEYQDRERARRPFPEPEPVPPPPAAPAVDARAARAGMWRRLLISAGLGCGLTLVLACCGFVASGPSGTNDIGSTLTMTAALLAASTVGVVVWIIASYRTTLANASGRSGPALRQYEQALAVWRQRAVAYDAAEAARLAGLPQWRAVGPRRGVGRVDVVGGSQWGWQGLLTVAGAGYLATHGPSTIVDLTGDGLCRDLYEMCVQSGVTVDVQVPPGDSDLLSGLDARQLVDVLVESVHGDGDHAVRADRAADDRILTAIVGALGEDVTLERIIDGLRVLMAAPGDTPSLGAAERARIAHDLFTADYLKQAAVALHRLESYLFPLRSLRATARAQAALTVVATATDGTSVRSELLNDLIVAWLTRRVGNHPDACRILVVAGADFLPARHVQRLGDVCARRGVALVLLWRHLRDSALRALGSGTVAFMRLGSAEEAVHAADYIGREHRFVLSGLTHTVGRSQTQTEATSYSDATSTGTSRGVTSGGHMSGLIHAARASSRADSSTTGVTRTVSTSSSTATGTSVSDASSTQRVYEYAVEPTVLQGLPEYALLLVEHTLAGSSVRALDCNPAIVTLPSVDMNTTAAPILGAGGYSPPVVSPAMGAGPVVPVQRAKGTTEQYRQAEGDRWAG